MNCIPGQKQRWEDPIYDIVYPPIWGDPEGEGYQDISNTPSSTVDYRGSLSVGIIKKLGSNGKVDIETTRGAEAG